MNKNTDLVQIWNKVPPNYYEVGEKRNVFQIIWHKEKWRQIREVIKKNAETVLDVGCSSGHITHKIHSLLPEAKIYGLDVYDKAIVYGRKKYKNVEFVLADAHSIPFPPKTFDVVLSTESLEHVLDPQKVLREIKRVLKDDGQLIVEMDSGNWLFRAVWYFWTRIGLGKVWRRSHLTIFNSLKLKKMITSTGFIIKETKPTHWGMGVIIVASKK